MTTRVNNAMNQTEFQEIKGNLFKAREKKRGKKRAYKVVWFGIGFGFAFAFASHWPKNWRELFKPITERRNRVINLDNHYKGAPKGKLEAASDNT